MKIVTASSDLTIAAERGRVDLTLRAGSPYIMHEIEVESGRQAGAFARIDSLPNRPMPFDAKRDMSGALIVPFIGGLGDALSMLPLFVEISRRFPRISIEVATTPGPAAIFALAPEVRKVLSYPLTFKAWSTYPWYLSMECVHQSGQEPGRALPEVFAAAAGLQLLDATVKLSAPDAGESEGGGRSGDSIPLIGLAVGDGFSLRAYPLARLQSLIDLFSLAGTKLVLLGHADENWKLETDSQWVTDLRSKTPTIRSLISRLRELDLLIAHDSMIMHLAGALGLPVMGLFAPTSVEHGGPYPSVMPIGSDALCAPCHCATDQCPKGFKGCIAWESTGLSPESLVEVAINRISALPSARIP